MPTISSLCPMPGGWGDVYKRQDLTLDPGESNLDQDFGYQPTFTVCPVGADNRWTDILGVGMGLSLIHI